MEPRHTVDIRISSFYASFTDEFNNVKEKALENRTIVNMQKTSFSSSQLKNICLPSTSG